MPLMEMLPLESIRTSAAGTPGQEMDCLAGGAAKAAGEALGVNVAPGNENIHASKDVAAERHRRDLVHCVSGEEENGEARGASDAAQELQQRSGLLERLAAAEGDSFDLLLSGGNFAHEPPHRREEPRFKGVGCGVETSGAGQAAALHPDGHSHAWPVGPASRPDGMEIQHGTSSHRRASLASPLFQAIIVGS